MSYSVRIAPHAARQLRRLPVEIQTRIKQRIADLSQDPRPPGFRPLKNQPYMRLRVGDYRVVYEIEDDQLRILVVLIGHRRNIYNQLDRL